MKQHKSLIHTLEQPQKDIYIYLLKCPDTNNPKYVGLATTGFTRIKQHYKCSSGTKIKSWIVNLRKNKKIFKIDYLEYFDLDGPHVDEAEIKWIKHFKDQGIELLNLDLGGRTNYLRYSSVEARKLQSERAKIYNGTIEMKKLFSDKSKAQWQNPEIRQKMIDARVGIEFTEEQLKNMKNAQTKAKGVVIQDSTGRIFNSMQEAADFFKVQKSTIQRALYSNTKQLGDIKLTRIGGGAKPVEELRPMNSYFTHKTTRRWKKTLLKQAVNKKEET